MLDCLRKLGLLMCTDNTREVSVAHECEINCMDGNLYPCIICDIIEKKNDVVPKDAGLWDTSIGGGERWVYTKPFSILDAVQRFACDNLMPPV